jgi:YD repeat-containing protein
VAVYYSYDGDGRRTRIERKQVGDRYTTYFGYDDASRLVSEEWLDGGGSGLYAFSWEYDAAGRLAVLADPDGWPTYSYYNGAGQLYCQQDALISVPSSGDTILISRQRGPRVGRCHRPGRRSVWRQPDAVSPSWTAVAIRTCESSSQVRRPWNSGTPCRARDKYDVPGTTVLRR